MAKPVCITADSTCDLSKDLSERFDIRIIPLSITLDNESFPDDGRFTSLELYRRFRQNGVLPSTSAPSPSDFYDFFHALTEAGNEVVHLDISGELSGSVNNARLAASELEGVHVIDSRMLSTGVGLLAIEGAECRDRGMDAADIAEHLTALTEKVDTSFVLDTLTFMQKGGRCSNMAVLGANLLKLKPALEMSGGKLGVYKKYRGNIEQVYPAYIRERLDGKDVRPGHIFLTDSGEVSEDILAELENVVRACVPVREIHHTVAGCTVASHCGPKTLGVLFLRA